MLKDLLSKRDIRKPFPGRFYSGPEKGILPMRQVVNEALYRSARRAERYKANSHGVWPLVPIGRPRAV